MYLGGQNCKFLKARGGKVHFSQIYLASFLTVSSQPLIFNRTVNNSYRMKQ